MGREKKLYDFDMNWERARVEIVFLFQAGVFSFLSFPLVVVAATENSRNLFLNLLAGKCLVLNSANLKLVAAAVANLIFACSSN